MTLVPDRLLRIALAAGALAVLVLLLGHLTALRGQDTDLYPRWYGLRQLLFHGRNPYGDDVSREIASQIWFFDGHVSRPESGPATPLESIYGFLYPLPGALLLAPLALLPYPAAFTAWLLLALLMLPAAAWLAFDATLRARPARRSRAERAVQPADVRPPSVRRRTTPSLDVRPLLVVPLALFFLPAWANLMLGQPAPAIAFFTALAVWLGASESTDTASVSSRAERGISAAVRMPIAKTEQSVGTRLGFLAALGTTKGQAATIPPLAPKEPPSAPWRPVLAGASLAAAGCLKPHLLALLGPLWLGFHLVQWWRGDRRSAAFVAGTIGGGSLLAAVSFALLPSWPLDFWHAARNYVAVGPGGSALLVMAQLVLPDRPAWVLATALSFAVVGWIGYVWWRALAADRTAELRAIWMTIVVSALVVPPAWETNGVMVLLPLAAALAVLPTRRAAVTYVVASAAATVALLPPYFVLGWQRGTLVIGAYLALLAGALLCSTSVGAVSMRRPRRGEQRRVTAAPGWRTSP